MNFTKSRRDFERSGRLKVKVLRLQTQAEDEDTRRTATSDREGTRTPDLLDVNEAL